MHKDDTYKLSARPIDMGDVEPLVQYWMTSSDEHLLGMGVDLAKKPNKEDLVASLEEQILLPLSKKMSLALIWEVDGKAIGHNNVNHIHFGEFAHMHLHIWNTEMRRKGLGKRLLQVSIPQFFELLDLQYLVCEPYALNPAPNRTLEKLGFEFEKRYTTVPGSINFEQEVNRWILTKTRLDEVKGYWSR